jgi:AcrR family transcriptional regulator
MEQIAEAADIAKGTLYNYFPVKEAILSGFIQQGFAERLPGRLAALRELPDTRHRMAHLFTELLEGVRQHQVIFERYLVYRMQNVISFAQDDDEKSGIDRLGWTIIQAGQAAGELRQDLPPFVLEDLFEFCFIIAAKQMYRQPDTEPEAIIRRSVDLFINGAGLAQ